MYILNQKNRGCYGSLFLSIFFIFFSLNIFSQSSLFELNANYGAAYSFFVKYEQDPSEVPAGYISFFNKNRIGTNTGIELIWNIGKGNNAIGIAHEREVHYGKKNSKFWMNDELVIIEDFKLRHLNRFYELFYRRKIENTYIIGGTFLLDPHQQEIDYFTYLTIEERNNKNSRLMEGGFFIGIEYMFYKDNHFEIGLKSKAFHTTSGGYMESIIITPSLKYKF